MIKIKMNSRVRDAMLLKLKLQGSGIIDNLVRNIWRKIDFTSEELQKLSDGEQIDDLEIEFTKLEAGYLYDGILGDVSDSVLEFCNILKTNL